MAKRDIIIGTPNSRTGDSLYVAFGKIKENFDELYNIVQLPEDTPNIDGGSASTVFDDEN
jgi:hypothetical protein